MSASVPNMPWWAKYPENATEAQKSQIFWEAAAAREAESGLRIGHRGLEHRQVDDTYWLNGTLIDDRVYNQELQRIIAHQQVTDEAKLRRELQQQADLQNARNAQAEAAAKSVGTSLNVLYGYASIYPTRPASEHQTTFTNCFTSNGSGGRSEAHAALPLRFPLHADAPLVHPLRVAVPTQPGEDIMTVVLSSFRARQEAQERDLAIEALKVSDGCVSAAARLCGLNRISMRRIIERHALQKLIKPGSKANLTQRGNAVWRALADV